MIIYMNIQYNQKVSQGSMETNKKLLQCYKNNASFQLNLKKNEKQYNQILNESSYHKYEGISKDVIRKLVIEDKQVYFFFGFMYDPVVYTSNQLKIFLIKQCQLCAKKPYYFVYLNHKAKPQAYGHLKTVFLDLTLNHYLNLQNFIAISLSLSLKISDFFSMWDIPYFLRSKTVNMNSCLELCQLLKIEQKELLQLLPGAITQRDFSDYYKKKGATNFYNNIFELRKKYESIDNKDQDKMEYISANIYEIDDYEMSNRGIPLILEILLFCFTIHPQFLQAEGLFRKSISIDDHKQLIKQLSQKNYVYILQIQNPHLIANLIKKILFGLKYPIIDEAIYSKLMQLQDINNQSKIKSIVESLPLVNYITIRQLFKFFNEKLLKDTKSNKMTAQSLAIVFAPCLMKPQTLGVIDLLNAGKNAKICQLLIEDYSYYFNCQSSRGESIYFESTTKNSRKASEQIHYFPKFNSNNTALRKSSMIISSHKQNPIQTLKTEPRQQQSSFSRKMSETSLHNSAFVEKDFPKQMKKIEKYFNFNKIKEIHSKIDFKTDKGKFNKNTKSKKSSKINNEARKQDILQNKNRKWKDQAISSNFQLSQAEFSAKNREK